MHKEIAVDGRKINYTLRKSRRARQVRLAVYHDGSVVLTAPWGWPEQLAERFLGQKIGWLLGKLGRLREPGLEPLVKTKSGDYELYKEQARELVLERVAHFNRLYKFRVKSISIRNQKTRWGSCSKQGNLSFNFKLALLPRHLADYIVVHELCHLAEFNHSPQFWNLVERGCPGYRAARQELRGNGNDRKVIS